jgi:tetratricopeptide (TPR) repeat protein
VIARFLPRDAGFPFAVLFVALGAFGAGCAHRPPPQTPVRPTIQTTPIVITPREDEAPEAVFQRAELLLAEGKGAEAGALFDRLAALDPAGPIAPMAHYKSGVAWDVAGDYEGALARFRAVRTRYADRDIGRLATIGSLRLEAYLEQWSQLSASADLFLARADLGDVDRIEGYGAKALAIVETGDADGAERYIARGRDIIESLRLGEGGKLPVQVAQVFFALGEIRRVRGEAITFVPVPPNFADALEKRCQLLLDAQSAYSDAMRSYETHWPAMSGYRVGELYQKLHRDVLAIPAPTTATSTEKKRLFEGAMALRYRILLEKGLKMMDHTVLFGEKTGEASTWITRARAAKRDIERALEEQKAKLAALPYSEKDLQKALDDLAAKSRP